MVFVMTPYLSAGSRKIEGIEEKSTASDAVIRRNLATNALAVFSLGHCGFDDDHDHQGGTMTLLYNGRFLFKILTLYWRVAFALVTVVCFKGLAESFLTAK